MQASFIIPLHNSLELTKDCLRSLQATLPPDLVHEIIFVDDVSTDGTREWLATLPQPCRAILNEKNLGFAGTCNAGAEAASGEILFFLNNDLVLLPGWFEPMLTGCATTDAGLVGNIQLDAKSGKIDHTGIEVSAEAKLVHRRSQPRWWSRFIGSWHRPPAVTAACCAIRRSLFREAGGFDIEFQNGGEDVDLCLRLRERGYPALVTDRSVVRHHVRATRGPAGRADEVNSRRLFAHWRRRLLSHGYQTWARETTTHFLHRPTEIGWRTGIAACAHHFGLTRQAPTVARLKVGSALFYEELHWEATLTPNASIPSHPASAYTLTGVYQDRVGVSTNGDTVWLRDVAHLRLPAGFPRRNIFVNGFVVAADNDRPDTHGSLGLRLTINGEQRVEFSPLPNDHFNCGIDRPLIVADEATEVRIELLGVSRSNFLAWLGRKTARWPLPRRWRDQLQTYRLQRLNHRLRLSQIVCDDEVVYDFKQPSPLLISHRWRNAPTGLNLIGWFRAAVGIGESVRCMARACDAANLPTALVDLRLNCLNRTVVAGFDNRLQATNPHAVNVFHLDPPQSEEIDHHHGPAFRDGKYNIAYWAWELPEFPDNWVRQCQYFDEIWCPSEYVRNAIAAKVPLPVLVMPHAIELPPMSAGGRARFDLPSDHFLFLFAYDLNSYQERKNPLAVVAAYRQAFPNEEGVGLVIKTQNPDRDPAAFARLQAALTGLRHARIIAESLPAPDVHALQASCDAFVSLHRAEGFGLSLAECMYYGKPVIATDWSATAEFLHAGNGCPVRHQLVKLTENHGPYRAGQIWAEPDIEHAASWMRRLVDEPGLASQLGQAAAAEIRTRFAPAVIGARYRSRLEAFPLWPA